MPRPASKIHAVVALKSTLRFISNLAALVPAECNDALQVSTLGEKLISGCEVPPQPIRNCNHVDSSSDRSATDQKDLRRIANMHPKQNRAGKIDLYRRLAKRRPCAGVLPLASLLSFCASCACLPQQPKNAWRPHASWANYWPRTTRVNGRRLLFPLQSLYSSHWLN